MVNVHVELVHGAVVGMNGKGLTYTDLLRGYVPCHSPLLGITGPG